MDKLGTAKKLAKFLKDSGIGDLAEINAELIRVGSFEAAVEAAKRDLESVQASKAQVTADINKAREGIQRERDQADEYCARKEAQADVRTKEADVYYEKRREAADGWARQAQADAVAIVAEAQKKAEEMRAQTLESLATTIRDRDSAAASLRNLNLTITERQGVLDQIEKLLGKYAGR